MLFRTKMSFPLFFLTVVPCFLLGFVLILFSYTTIMGIPSSSRINHNINSILDSLKGEGLRLGNQKRSDSSSSSPSLKLEEDDRLASKKSREGVDRFSHRMKQETGHLFTAIMFTTWVENPEKTRIRLNVLQTWKTWKPDIIPLMFTDDKNIRRQAAIFGWGIQHEPRKVCSGVPLYREMYREAMKTYDSALYGFVNGDILLGDGILKSLKAVAKRPTIFTKPVMVVLRRINVDFVNRPPITNVTNIAAIAKEGRPMTDGSGDGIFTNRLFPWDHVPDIVAGRIGISMWMVSYAREMGVEVIDISETTIGVHMTTQAGNTESWRHVDNKCNHKVYGQLNIKPQSWFCGFVRCAEFKTVEVTEKGVTEVKVVDQRVNSSVRCGECHMNLKPLLHTIF